MLQDMGCQEAVRGDRTALMRLIDGQHARENSGSFALFDCLVPFPAAVRV